MKAAGGGGKRGGRKPRRVELDDRPRGYEAARMRRLWHDIDHAKRKAGLGPAPDAPPAPGWDLAGVVEWATVLAGDAAVWVTTNAPMALALLATGVDLLRNVPVVGRLVDFVPPAEPPPRKPQLAPRTDANGHAHAPIVEIDLDDDGPGPDGKWIH